MIVVRSAGVLLLLLLLVSQGAQAAIAIAELDQPPTIVGLWQFRAGDDPAWAAPGLDDGDWEAVDLLSTAPAVEQGAGGMS